MRNLLLAVATALFSCSVLPAQTVGTGVYPFASFDNRGFDSVNIGNLNTRFNVPIVSKAGRGLAFNYSIQSEGLIWAPVTNASTSTVTWVPDPSWGFTGLLNGTAFNGLLTHVYTPVTCGSHGGTKSTNFIYHDAYGAAHPFNHTITVCNSMIGTTGTGAALDGSGYTVTNYGSLVKTKTGTVITPAYSSTVAPTPFTASSPNTASATASGSPTSQTDSNGNTISFDGTSTFTDTTGQTPLTITGSGPVTFTYPVVAQAGGATTASANLYYKQYTVRTNFGCSGVTEFGSTPVNLYLYFHL